MVATGSTGCDNDVGSGAGPFGAVGALPLLLFGVS